MFETWTDDQFFPWLAGFFDGEGCIYLPEGAGVEISIANTERAVIEGIRDRLRFGIINAVTHSQQNWKTKYHWRLRNYPEIYVVLSLIRPYLVIKAEKADMLLQRARTYLAERQESLERNRQIYEMSRTQKQKDVATHFGLTRQAVKYIVDNYGREVRKGRRPQITRKHNQLPESAIRLSAESTFKEPAQNTTKAVLLE